MPRKSVSPTPRPSRSQGLLPVGMATSHCSVGVAVDAVLLMPVAEVTVSRPDAPLRFFDSAEEYRPRRGRHYSSFSSRPLPADSAARATRPRVRRPIGLFGEGPPQGVRATWWCLLRVLRLSLSRGRERGGSRHVIRTNAARCSRLLASRDRWKWPPLRDMGPHIRVD